MKSDSGAPVILLLARFHCTERAVWVGAATNHHCNIFLNVWPWQPPCRCRRTPLQRCWFTVWWYEISSWWMILLLSINMLFNIHMNPSGLLWAWRRRFFPLIGMLIWLQIISIISRLIPCNDLRNLVILNLLLAITTHIHALLVISQHTWHKLFCNYSHAQFFC